MPSSGTDGSYGILFLVFKGISILSSIEAASVYIPTNCTGGFPSLHTLSSIYYFWGKSIFNFWRNTQYFIRSSCNSSHSYSRCTKLHQQYLNKKEAQVQRSKWLVQRHGGVWGAKIRIRVSWLFECLLWTKMLNLDFGVSGVEAPWWWLVVPGSA